MQLRERDDASRRLALVPGRHRDEVPIVLGLPCGVAVCRVARELNTWEEVPCSWPGS